jgi:hypothetical protein
MSVKVSARAVWIALSSWTAADLLLSVCDQFTIARV